MTSPSNTAALRESVMRRISKARAYLARSRNRKGETAMITSNTAWAREGAHELYIKALADAEEEWRQREHTGTATQLGVHCKHFLSALIAVERKAKEECARLAEAMCPYPAQSATNMRNGIAIAIRSTLPPTSKTE